MLEAIVLNVVFECAVLQSSTELLVEYRISNQSDQTIGIFNRLPVIAIDGARSYPPDAVYVDFKDGALLLQKLVLPIPDGLSMAMREAPDVTRLLPNEKIQERFGIALPAKAQNPLRRAAMVGAARGAEVAADDPKTAHQVVVSVGFFPSEPTYRFTSISNDLHDTYRVWPPGPSVDHQQILSKTIVLKEPIRVLDYRVTSSP